MLRDLFRRGLDKALRAYVGPPPTDPGVAAAPVEVAPATPVRVGPLVPPGAPQGTCWVACDPSDVAAIEEAVEVVPGRPLVTGLTDKLAAAFRSPRVEVIAFSDIAERRCPLVVLASGAEEATAEARLRVLWQLGGRWPLSLHDPYRAGGPCPVAGSRRFRDVTLSLEAGTLSPTLRDAWHLVNAALEGLDRPLDVLAVHPGAGEVGFSLKREAPVPLRSLALLADDEPSALAMRQTALDPSLEAQVATDPAELPGGQGFDLVVGDPSRAPAAAADILLQVRARLRPRGRALLLDADGGVAARAPTLGFARARTIELPGGRALCELVQP